MMCYMTADLEAIRKKKYIHRIKAESDNKLCLMPDSEEYKVVSSLGDARIIKVRIIELLYSDGLYIN